MEEQIEQFTKRADEFYKGQLVIGIAELKIILNDNYISKEEVKQIIKELEYDEADLISKRFILTILNKLT